MTASIADGRTMIFSGGIGVVTPEATTAKECMEQAGLGWKVELRDAGFRAKGGIFKASSQGTKAVVRVDDEGTGVEDFGYVGRRYNLIQNADVFDWCDRLVDDVGAKYEAAWSLYGGREVGLTMRFPEEILIAGEDAHAQYLLARTRHDGTGSMVASAMIVRLYCTNMVQTALKSATGTVRIPHLANATQKLQAARDSLQVTFRYGDEFAIEMQKLIDRTIAEDQADEIIREVLAVNRFGALDQKVVAVRTLHRESPTLQDELRGTRYGVFQAFTEWADWARVARTPQARAIDMLDGRVKKAKDQVFAALSAA